MIKQVAVMYAVSDFEISKDKTLIISARGPNVY